MLGSKARASDREPGRALTAAAEVVLMDHKARGEVWGVMIYADSLHRFYSVVATKKSKGAFVFYGGHSCPGTVEHRSNSFTFRADKRRYPDGIVDICGERCFFVGSFLRNN